MRRRPHLVNTTRKLHIRWQADVSTPAPHYLVNTCELLGQVVPLFVALESLELSLGPANHVTTQGATPIHALERIIRNCHFPHLRSCSLSAERTKGDSPYTSILGSFLASLPILRYLKLSDLHAGVEYLPLEALPLLTSFRGSADAAASILPGRPVQYLSLIGEDSDVNRDNLPRMTYTTLPLRCLDLSAMSIRPILLRNVSTHLPTVESLRLRLALRHTLHYSFSGIRILAGLSSVLRAFSKLAFLDLSPTSVDGVGKSFEELALCIEWHQVCPTLKRIIFPSQMEWIINLDHSWTLVLKRL
ncbi:hypothetical protein BYT27DRAFT_7198410 [Phlegmacium glaucopus]|nr:hypothetical protein BYT27DRAFT_7198410 [Phlegmacium glaucopus]